MTILSAESFLESLIDYEKSGNFSAENFTLGRIERLLALLGNPHRHLKIIHVAGSKGKGSTCAMAACILAKAGYKVGLYTSPHLNHYRERIRVLGGVQKNNQGIFPDSITQEELDTCLQEIIPAAQAVISQEDQGGLTFFETCTALALYYFRKLRVDFVVLETGLGGRLDATNAVDSMVCAVTPISLEHTQLLGGTLEKIAAEKAAIIKNKTQKVVIAQQPENARTVFDDRCRQFGITSSYMAVDARTFVEERSPESQTVTITTTQNNYPHLRLFLIGDHQLLNAKAAIGIIEELRALGHKIDDTAVYEGLAGVFWPGRFEIIQRNPTIVLDGAHNNSSAAMLANTFEQTFPHKKATVVVGISEDKDKVSVCRELNRVADKVIATKADHPRSASWAEEELKEYFVGKDSYLTKDVRQALAKAKELTAQDGFIVVAGSLFVVSEARRICINSKG